MAQLTVLVKQLIATFLICHWSLVNGQDECLSHFTQEPVENLHCNPYISKDEIRIECSVSGPLSTTIQWWWMAGETISPVLLQDDGLEIRIQTFTGTRGERSFIQVRNLSSRTGTYWCQPVLEDGTRLEESNRQYLANEDEYVNEGLTNCGNPIDETFSQISNRCISLDDNDATSSPATSSIGNEQANISSGVTSTSNQTSPSREPDGGLDLNPALYSIIAVIVLFCLVIVVLTVCIMAMHVSYKKKHRVTNNQHVQLAEENELEVETSTIEAPDDAPSQAKGTAIEMAPNLSYRDVTQPQAGEPHTRDSDCSYDYVMGSEPSVPQASTHESAYEEVNIEGQERVVKTFPNKAYGQSSNN